MTVPPATPDPPPSALGERIRQHRILSGLTQRQLGEAVNVSFTHISKIEAGKEIPSAGLLADIARTVDADPDELLFLAERIPQELRALVMEKADLAPRFLREWGEGRIRDADVERLLAKRGVRGGRVHPRSHVRHEQNAEEVLTRFAKASGWVASLPVPVESIAEFLGLRIVWEVLPERRGERILGALDPVTNTVHMNERHLALFEDVVGPLNFTLAHELGHWRYDVEDQNQVTLGESSNGDAAQVLCRGLRHIAVDDTTRIREVNANRFAACLVLPREIVALEIRRPFRSVAEVKAAAAQWGVSRRTLEIRLREIGRGSFLPILG